MPLPLHPQDEFVHKYHKLLAERDEMDRQLRRLDPVQKRRAEIEKELEALRTQSPTPASTSTSTPAS